MSNNQFLSTSVSFLIFILNCLPSTSLKTAIKGPIKTPTTPLPLPKVVLARNNTGINDYKSINQSTSLAKCNKNLTIIRGPSEKLLSPMKIKQSYRDVDFSLRGPIYLRIDELEREIEFGANKSFTKIIKAHLVDSQGMGQKPNTFIRQIIAAMAFPQATLNSSRFPSDVQERAKVLLNVMGGNSIGSFTNPRGLPIVRNSVAKFISKRDEIKAESENIYLTNGVSGGIELALQLVQSECGESVGIMVPVPLYPLYSAFITKLGLKQINYYLNPEDEWALEVSELESAYQDALCSCNCTPRVIIVINPGNPTGKILRRGKLEEIIKFANSKNLIIFADEVYQHNTLSDIPFISMRKVLLELGEPYNKMELMNFFSISKGFVCETALRGGYMELINFDKGIFDTLFKLVSVNLCPNVMGQVGMYAFMNPPLSEEPSFELYETQKVEILSHHKIIAKKFVESFNNSKGFKCTTLEGGAVAFIKFNIPKKAVKMAESKEQFPDVFYGLSLLEDFGVSVAVGSAFGLTSDQNYLRIALPSNFEDCDRIIKALKTFDEKFVLNYSESY